MGKSMDRNILIGNLCTLLAMGVNAVSSTRKTVKGVLGLQNVGQVIYCVSSLVLGGYSAAVQNVVSILRNLAAIRNIKSKAVEWTLVTAGVVLGVWFNNRGIMGLLPVVGNLLYTLAIFRFLDNERLLKVSFLICSACVAVFNLVIFNFVGVVSDTVVVVTTAAVLYKGFAKKSDPEDNETA